MAFLYNQLDLFCLLAFFKKLFVRRVDELANIIVFDKPPQVWDVESADHISPILLYQVAYQELLPEISLSTALGLSRGLDKVGNAHPQMITDRLFVETSRLYPGRLLLFYAQLSVVRRDGRDREVTQDEGIIVRDTQTVCVDMSMSHTIVIEKFEQEKAFVVQIRILFLCEYLLTAVTFFITIVLHILIVLSSCCRSIEHVDNRCLGKVNERDIIENGMSFWINDKYLLTDTWKELTSFIFSAIL